MQKSVRVQFEDYEKLRALAKQAGVPLSKYVGMLLDPIEDKKTKQAIEDARRALSVIEVLATRPETK